MKIVQLDPQLIDDHPRNEAIYGAPDPSEDFVESVRKHGILQPLTVRRMPGGRYQNIGGHRRKYTALLLQLPTVPCEIHSIDSEAVVLEMLIALNADREKTPAMRWNEMETLEIALSEQKKESSLQALTGGAVPDVPDGGHRENSGRTVELLAERFHYSKRFVERLQVVYSDRYRADYFRQLETSKAASRMPACKQQWDDIRAKCTKGDISISGAADAIVALKKETIKPPKAVRRERPKKSDISKPKKLRTCKMGFEEVDSPYHLPGGWNEVKQVEVCGVTITLGATMHNPPAGDYVPVIKIGNYVTTLPLNKQMEFGVHKK